MFSDLPLKLKPSSCIVNHLHFFTTETTTQTLMKKECIWEVYGQSYSTPTKDIVHQRLVVLRCYQAPQLQAWAELLESLHPQSYMDKVKGRTRQ